LSSFLGIRAVFLVTGTILLLLGGIVLFNTNAARRTIDKDATAEN